MSKTLNRRAILAGAAATATVPAAATCCAGETNPDAELLSLGVQLEAIAQEWTTAAADSHETDERCDERCGRHNRLTDAILARTAQTREGLAVQIRATTLMTAELWTSKNCDAPHERAFIEAVCRFAGVPVPELRLSV